MHSHPFRTAISCAVFALTAAAAPRAHAFTVEFQGCVESIGVTVVPTANALALTPPAFFPVGLGGPVTPIVVRTADCAGIGVDGSKPKRGSVVQIGAVIVGPAPQDEQVDVYTFWYYTTDGKLAHRLKEAGIAAQHVAPIDYDVDPGEVGSPIDFVVDVPRPGNPHFHLAGTVTPIANTGSFRSMWWQQTAAGNVLLDTSVPQIATGVADLTLTTGAGNALSDLIGATTTGFPIFPQFNVFPAAHMTVEISP